MTDPAHQYVSRGGLKLEHALREFGVDPAGFVCADLGASTGGFTHCLLVHGAVRVYAVDTAYGELAWSLRSDGRVIPMERANALHTPPPADAAERVDLVVADLGWTPQRLLVPVAMAWLKPGGRLITLVKPHYERSAAGISDADAGVRRGRGRREEHILSDEDGDAITTRVVEDLRGKGYVVSGLTRSPIVGGASKNKSGRGNPEWLALIERGETNTGGHRSPAGA